MTQYQVTIDQELLHRLFLSDSKDDGLAALLESVVDWSYFDGNNKEFWNMKLSKRII